MLGRVLVGVLIGLAAAWIYNRKLSINPKTLQITQVFACAVAIGFIASSFMFGAVYGAMAVAEVAFGYFVFTKLSQGRGGEQ